MALLPISLVASVALLCGSIAAWLLLWPRPGHRFPPGPAKRLLWGNLFDMPTEYEYVKFRQWSKQHGPVMWLSMPGKSIIVLDKHEAAVDLLDKRSSIYSDRPALTMLRDVVGWNWSIVMLNYGERLRKQRKVLHRGLNDARLVEQYALVQEDESFRLLKNLLKDPAKFMDHSERWGRSMISRVTYDYDPNTENDRYIWVAGQCENIIAQAGRPGAYLVDVFPMLKYVPTWFPFARFKRQGREWSVLVRELLESPFAFVTKKMHEGKNSPCYVANLLEAEVEDKDAVKETAAIVHIAGANSIIATVQAFILAMTLYPEVQLKAQAEIDAVIGKDRLPKLGDRPHLPYINCIVSEMLRWSRAVPLGIAHELNQDDYYQGMFLPARSVILANSWSMTRDEKIYENPEIFLPERFEASGTRDPRDIVFGFGRRMCPGKNFADAAIFSAVASILAVFRISMAVDENGDDVVPEVDYTPGFVCNPKPFRCAIVPRSSKAIGLIEED